MSGSNCLCNKYYLSFYYMQGLLLGHRMKKTKMSFLLIFTIEKTFFFPHIIFLNWHLIHIPKIHLFKMHTSMVFRISPSHATLITRQDTFYLCEWSAVCILESSQRRKQFTRGTLSRERNSMCKEVELWEPSIWKNMKNKEELELMLR